MGVVFAHFYYLSDPCSVFLVVSALGEKRRKEKESWDSIFCIYCFQNDSVLFSFCSLGVLSD